MNMVYAFSYDNVAIYYAASMVKVHLLEGTETDIRITSYSNYDLNYGDANEIPYDVHYSMDVPRYVRGSRSLVDSVHVYVQFTATGSFDSNSIPFL
jgi:hypothetical protein